MPVLYDRQGKAHNIPEDQVPQALASGNFAFPKGKDILMKGEGGELYDVPPQEALEMYQRGYRIESEAERKERELQEQYGGAGGQIATAAHAIGNTLTFGGLDFIGSEIGGKEYTEPVKKLKQANPDTDLAFELGTLAGSFLVPGGQAGAIAKLTKLPRGVAKIGRGVEKAVLKGMGGAKGGLVRQALAKGASMGLGTGVEGAIYESGRFLSEASLGETEFTAENLLSNMGTGAMWGGIAGGGMGAGGEILRRGLGAGVNFAKRSSKSVVNMWERATGNKAVPGLADAIEEQIKNPKIGKYATTMGAALREEPENLARFLQKGEAGKEARRIGSQSAKERDTIITRLSDDLDRVEDLYEGAAEQMMGKMKIKNMGSIKAVKNEVAAATEATAMIEDTITGLDEMIASGDYKFSPALGRLKKAKISLERHQKDLNKILVRGGDDIGAQLHGITDSAKRDIGKFRDTLKRVQQTTDVADIRGKLEDIYENFRVHLEKPEFYGAVATAQKEFNSVWSRVIGRGKGVMGRKLREKIGEAAWKDVYATNRGSMEHFINDLGRARNKNMEEFFISQLDDKIAFASKVRDTFDELPASLTRRLDEAEDLARRLKSEYQTAHKTVALQNQMGDIIQKSSQLQSILPMTAGAGVGYLLGGEEGLALGLGLSVFANPGRLIQIRAALDRLSSNQSLNITKSIKKYIGKATGKIKPTARKMLAPTSMKILQNSNWGDKRTKDKTRAEAFERRTKELTEFLSNPQKAVDRITRNTGDVSEVAPNVATAMQIKAVKAARYLYDKAPKPRDRGVLLSGKWKPPDHELAKFERIADVVNGGAVVVLKNLEAGILTVPEVEAFRENWPRQYEQVAMTLIEQIPELQDKLPYKERVQLQILFPEVRLEPTMDAGFRQAIAMIDAVPQGAPGELPGKKQPKSKLGDYKDLSLDKTSLSSTQRIEMNKIT